MLAQNLADTWQTLPKLVKGSESYKLIITKELQKKIDYLCTVINDVEWSGTLFYTVKGDFKAKGENRLVVTAIDLFLQDIGTSGYTEFSFSPTLAHYICMHPNLLEEGVFQGLIHSHNNMQTFFSGTDTSTLQKEGAEKDNFVSLIVNNHREYTAGITSKCIIKSKVSQVSFYKTFFGKIVEKEDIQEKEEEVIEWYNLEVSIPENKEFTEIDECIKEIREEKKRKEELRKKELERRKTAKTPSRNGQFVPFIHTPSSVKNGNTLTEGALSDINFDDWIDSPQLPFEEDDLFDDKDYFSKKKDILIEEEIDYDDYDAYPVDKEHVLKIIRQLLSGSVLTAHNDKMDLEKFVKISDTLFKRRFPNDKEFTQWAENYVDILLSEVPSFSFTDGGIVDDMGIYAYHVVKELDKLPKNKYIDLFKDILGAYI
jgi:hypothetical protein